MEIYVKIYLISIFFWFVSCFKSQFYHMPYNDFTCITALDTSTDDVTN